MSMSCGCITYPCMHTQMGGLGQLQSNQSLYYEMLRQSMGMQSIQQPTNQKENENKRNKKLLLLRK